ncbi:putative cytochrome P450 94B3 [Iris pallida]|uniref:Cytochrome P450 94B3 n=1 Tax=Iris pallida TaxID=29817 RepID=A0AAX6F6T0_IRIPA|nr:putative cytochrome P450 94B3 [Iris pallida]KAJ6838472.1 putative cytochrome P450 94B3 [Iris pallida]
MAKSWTMAIDSVSRSSDPIPSSFLIFQKPGRAYRNLSALKFAASLKASAKLDGSFLDVAAAGAALSSARQAGSSPKATLQMLSKA